MSDLLTLVLDKLKADRTELSVPQLTAFLYICENEGLSLGELASAMRVTNQVASYTVRGLLDPGESRAIDPAAGLVAVQASELDARALAFSLTPKGERLRDHFDVLIAGRHLV